jgi:hypothetical protein
MGEVREAYVRAAVVAVGLLREPAVAAAWDKPSALADFTVGGLAAHLAAQVHNVPRALAAPRGGPPVSLAEHYANVPWLGTDLDAETNVAIRRAGEEQAADGPSAVADGAAAVVDGLPESLAAEPADRVVHLPWTGWELTLDDLLVTRMMEIVVHADDLAVSVGVPTPDFPDSVLEPALALLCRLAVRRHGPVAVLRALSRAERAPATISAL